VSVCLCAAATRRLITAEKTELADSVRVDHVVREPIIRSCLGRPARAHAGYMSCFRLIFIYLFVYFFIYLLIYFILGDFCQTNYLNI